MNLENLVDAIERHDERLGQISQQQEHPQSTQFRPSEMDETVVTLHNKQLAERVAALTPELRAARAAAIAH